MIVIGLSGKAGSGKDTAGLYMKLKYGFERVAFADYLKKVSKKVGWDNKKDERGRKLLQNLGSVVRDYDPLFWVDYAFLTIAKLNRQGQETFVITDLRYLNEVQEVRAQEGIVIRITSDVQNSDDLHPSEVELDGYKDWDFRLTSRKGQFDDYYHQIDTIITKILSGTWKRGDNLVVKNNNN